MNYEKTAYMPELTHRQWEVFWLAAAARLSNQEIADNMQVSVTTIKTHKRGIREALGVYGRTGLSDWYESNRETVSKKWLEKVAPPSSEDMAEDNFYGHNHETIYRFLTHTADNRNSVLGSLQYLDSLPPIVAAFINCHIQLMRLSGVVTERNNPAQPHLADTAHPGIGAAQSAALDRQDDAGLTELSERILWAREAALGVLAATSALLDNVNQRVKPDARANSFPIPISGAVEPTA